MEHGLYSGRWVVMYFMGGNVNGRAGLVYSLKEWAALQGTCLKRQCVNESVHGEPWAVRGQSGQV